VGLKRIVPPLQGSGIGLGPADPAVGLGFVRSPLWGSPAHALSPRRAKTDYARRRVKTVFSFSEGRRWTATGVLTSRRGPDEGSLPARERQMKMFFLLQGEKVAEGRGRMRGHFVRRSRVRQNKFKSSQEPPINEAGECRGHCEGAKEGKRDAGLGARAVDSPLVTCHLPLSSRPAAGSRERVRKSRKGIRRPLGPATAGCGDPSSDGRIDTRALTARKQPMTGCLRLAHPIYWRPGITGRRG
jgi:hypothetical protein